MLNTQVKALFVIVFGLVDSNLQSPELPGLFQPTNNLILATVDAVFTTLKISDNFTKSKIIAHYLSMHDFVKDTVKKNDKVYQNIYTKFKNVSKNKTGVLIFYIDKIIAEMIRRQKVKISHNKSKFRDTIHSRIVVDFIELAKGFCLNLNTSFLHGLLEVIPGLNPKGPDVNARRIFNGTDTTIAHYPFMASVHVGGRFACAGALIHTNLVLTAASGIIPFTSPTSNPRSIKVRVSSDYTNKFGELVPVAGLYFHPEFNKTTLRHNLAVIHLKKHLKLKEGRLITIQYDNTADQLTGDVKVLILGWGEKMLSPEPGYKYVGADQQLSLAHLDLKDLEECKHTYTRTYVSNKHFCAYSDNGGGACQLDVGAPAVVGLTLTGVASFGSPRCGQRDAPTVFTKLGFYADWIDSFFKQDPSHNQHNFINTSDSNETPADKKPFYHKIKTGLKSGRGDKLDNYVYNMDDDTFKKTKKPDPHTHPLIDKAIFLDPDLVSTMPNFSEERTDPSPPHHITDQPIHGDKDKENINWDLVDSFVSNIMATIPTSKGPITTTTTTEEPTLLPAGLATLTPYSQLTILSLFPVTSTTESAYREYVFVMPRRSTTANASAVPFTRMGTSFYFRMSDNLSRNEEETTTSFQMKINNQEVRQRGYGSKLQGVP